ncbi:MAG: exopolyphosphatase [Actinobacteria bacterium]|nr:exopolyphosphatase [Actinomycetota bacterium]
MSVLAAIDCGTNSIRLLIVRDGQEVLREMEIVKLGEGVDRTKRFSPAAVERTLSAVRKFRTLIDENKVEKIRFCATSATRDAENREIFIEPVAEILGVVPEVIVGTEEARLSFLGATAELPRELAPFLVVDIGGGSTEFVFGHDDVASAISVDIGCVRMTERHFVADPPSAIEIEQARVDINNAIDRAQSKVPITSARTLVAVAGTATTVAAAALDLVSYQREQIHGARISASQTVAVSDWLLSLPRDERAELGYMHPGRVDVIAAGALVLAEIIKRTKAEEFVASERDILDGIVASLR